MNYYERYCGDYGRDTAHLTLIQHGVYTVMLDTYYSTQRPLPSEIATLCRICRAMTPEERDAVASVAEEFFPVGSSGLRHNSRADREIAKAIPKIEAARENGKKGGRPKKQEATGTAGEPRQGINGKTHGVTHGKPKPNPAETHGQSSPAPTPVPTPTSTPTPTALPAPEVIPPSTSSLEGGPGEGFALQPQATPPADPPKGKRKAGDESAGTRLPGDWRIPEEWVTWAVLAYPQLTRQRIVKIAVEFHNFWLGVPGVKGKKSDWQATFRNRVAQVIERMEER